MSKIYWLDIHSCDQTPQLREALARWGFEPEDGPGDGTLLIVADQPDARWIPPEGTEILWWVKDATPEAVSEVLACRPGWVVRQSLPLEHVRASLTHIRPGTWAARAGCARCSTWLPWTSCSGPS